MSVRDTIKESIGKQYKISEDYVNKGIEGKEKKKIACEKCGSSGFIRVVNGGSAPPESKRCDCRRKQDLAENMERGWKGLVFAGRTDKTELSDYLRKNAWITSPIDIFKGHFRRVAIDKGPHWKFKVLTDADLVQAWLANIAMKGVEILDRDYKDIDPLETDYVTLEHAAKANSFLCIILGIKSASNKETTNVLMEVLRTRYQLNMPTWIVDQPEKPLSTGHLCYSTELDFFLRQWPHRRVRLASLNSSSGNTAKPENRSGSNVIENKTDEAIRDKAKKIESELPIVPSISHLVSDDMLSPPTPIEAHQTVDISSKLANRTRTVKKPRR